MKKLCLTSIPIDKIRADPNLIDDYIILQTPIIQQKVALVCYREGSNEIVGMNFTFIETKKDKYFEQFYPHVSKAKNSIQPKKLKSGKLETFGFLNFLV